MKTRRCCVAPSTFNRDEDIDVSATACSFVWPRCISMLKIREVYFVKSPKSFLGASGLKPQQVALFEDLVCAMMLHIKQQAQTQLPEPSTRRYWPAD
jgi:hypothetical chaperone protein